MPRKKYEVACPFFHSGQGTTIFCEGIIPDTVDRISFFKYKPRAIQFQTFCCDRFEFCERYEALMKNYQEDEA